MFERVVARSKRRLLLAIRHSATSRETLELQHDRFESLKFLSSVVRLV